MYGGGWWRYLSYDEEQDRPQLSWVLLKRVWGYARPYQYKTAGLLVTIFIITGLSLIPPLLYRDLIDNALPHQDLTRLNWLALGMIGIPIINALIGMVQRYLSATIGEHLIADLRNALFNHLHSQGLRFFTHSKTGELMSRLNNDVVGAQSALTGTFITVITNIVTVVSTLTIMISLEWRLTVLSVIILPLFIIPTRRVGRILREIRRESMDANAKMNSLMNETLNVSGVLLVKLFGRQREEKDKFQERSGKVAYLGVRSAMIGRWFFMGLGVVSAIGTAVVFWGGGYLVLQGIFTVGTIVAFGAYLTQLYGPLSAMSNAHIEFATSMVSFERVFEILDLPLEIEDKPDAVRLDDVAGRVTFDNVSFSYTEGGDGGAEALGLTVDRSPGSKNGNTPSFPLKVGELKMAIEDISFEIQPGQLAAVVGPSGAGKSTITYLLPRLYDPTSGRICLDGYDLRDVTQKSLAWAIGMVTQETYLFHDTLKANLLYARPDATQAEVEAACQAANIHHFIASLPDDYDTVVGERGYRLSGGEKQRIAIARVILKDPRILVLDEATSSLDSQSEALIQEALERIMQNRTSLVIAHRLSTILAADVILVMDEGRLVEQGRRTGICSAHETLLEQGGLYANLYHTQFRAVTGAEERLY
ncbi:MAG: ATP-binding cassette domain-containing protein [Phycisphaerae bacterium]|nr:ABC transporter ATP-binding protein [Gammaproteobacteria bacterium]NIU57163.1 ATP-binding cassette domain-containing protein [Phycisphaerae bacterium]NIW10589.1 ATP-binding cassette domain-containing protein [Gammaproteobacteria bacterium]NIW94344.1 ATP-binding cassette domain-containing protein [Phycisphaerae bacterium]